MSEVDSQTIMEKKNKIADGNEDKMPDNNYQDQSVVSIVNDIEVGWKFWKKRRYVVALLALFGFFSSYILRVNLSIAIVAMTTSTPEAKAEFDWDSKLQGHVLSAFFYGYLGTQVLGGWLGARMGGKRVFGIGIGVTAFTTLITPPLVRFNVNLFICLRVIEGLCEGVTVPCVHAIWSKWAPPLERSKLATLAISGNFVGTVFAMLTCGVMADKFGWPTIFYVYGVIALTATSLWWYYVTDKPEDDPRISVSELKYIQQSLGSSDESKNIFHPWKSILTSPAVLAISAAHFSENWGFYTMLTQLPKYMNDVLNFKLEKTGLFSALPYVAITIILPIGGQLADFLRSKKILTTTQVRKAFTCIPFINQTIFMILAAFTSTAAGAITCLTLSVGIGGFVLSGFFVNHLDIAPRDASVLIGITNSIGTLPGIISPIITGYVVQNKTAAEWKIILILAGCIYLVGGIIYLLFASGERQKWAEVTGNKDLKSYSNPVVEVQTDNSITVY